MSEKWSTAGGSKPLSYADLLRKAKEAKTGGDEQQQSSTAGTTSSSTSASASATALSPPPNARPPTFSSPSFPRPGMPLSPSSKPADPSTAGTPRTILSSPAGKAPAPRQHSHDASPLRVPQPNGIVKDHSTSSPSAPGPQAASPPLSSDNKSPTKSSAPSPNIWEVRRQQRAAAQAQSQQATTPVRPPARAATEPTAVVGAMVSTPARPQDSSSATASAKPAEETATKQTEAAKQSANAAAAPSSSMTKDTTTSTSTPPKGPKSTTITFDGNAWQRPSSSAGTPAAPTAQSKTPAIREGEDDNAWLSRVAMMNEGHHMLKKDRGASADGSGDDAKTPRKTAWGRFGALASPTPSPQPPAAAEAGKAPPQTPPPASVPNAGKAAQKADKDATPSASSTRPSSSTAPSKSDWPSLDEAERDRERPSTSSTSHGAAPPSFHPPGSTGSSTPVSVGGGSAGSTGGGGSNLDAIKGVVQIKNPAGQRKGGKNWVEIVPEITHSGPTPSRRNVLRGWAGKPGQQQEKEKGPGSSSTSRSRESTERAGTGQGGAATSSIQILSSSKGGEQKAHASSEGSKAAEEPRSSDTWDDEPPAPSAPTSRRGLHSPRSRQYKTPYPRRFGPPNADAEPETSTAAAMSDKAPTSQTAHPAPSSMRLNSDGSFSPARLTSARAQPYSRSKQEWEARSGMGRGRSASSFSEHDGGSSGAGGGGPSRRYPGHVHGESMSSSINDGPHGNHRHSHAPQGSMDQSRTYWDPSMAPMPPHHFVAGHESFSSPHEIPYGHPMLFDGTRFWPAFPVPHHPDFGAPYHHGPPIPSPQHHPSQAQHWHGPPLESAPAGEPQHPQRQGAPPNNAPPTAPDGPSGQPASEPPLQTPELPSGVAQLVSQVEWYCSSQNLVGDNFLRSQMDPASGWIPLSLISSFRRLRSMCDDVGLTLDHPEVQAALAASQYVELDDEGKKIRKRNDWAEWVLQPPRTPAMSNPGVASYVQPGAVPAGHHSSAPPVPNMSSSYDGPVVGSPRPLAPHAYYGQLGEDQAYAPPPPPPPAQAHPPPGMNFYPPSQPQPQHFYHAPQHPIYQSAPPNLTPTGPAAYSAIPPYAPAAMGAPQHPHHHHHHHHGIDHLTTPRDVPTWRAAPPMHWSRQDGLYSPVEAGHAAAAANAASAAQYGSAAHQPQSQHHSVAPRAPRQSLPTSASLPPHPDHHLHQQQQQQQQRGVLPVDLPGSRRNVAAAAASSSQDETRLPLALQSPTHLHSQTQPHAQPQPQPTFVRHASQQTDVTTTSTSSSGLEATPSAAGGGSGSGAANTATTAPTTTRTNSSVSVSLSLGAHSPSSPTSPASNRSAGGGGGGGVMIGEDGPTSSPSPTRRTKPPGLGHAQGQGQTSPTTLSRQHQKLANVDANQNHKKGSDAAAAAALSTGGARTSAHAASHHLRQREGSGDGGNAAAGGGGAAGGGAGGGDDSEDDCLGIVAAEGLGGLVEAKAQRTAAA